MSMGRVETVRCRGHRMVVIKIMILPHPMYVCVEISPMSYLV
jgi:hypothetical protein